MGRSNGCWSRVAVSLTAALLCACSGGCEVFGALAYKVMGPPPIPERYVLAKDPTLVMVENSHSGSAAIPEADALARVVHEDLSAQAVAPMIDPARVHDLRDVNPIAFGKMSITEVARRVGAKQVIYIQVNHLNIETPPGADVLRLSIGANVKVVDATTSQTKWPEGGEPEAYAFASPFQRVTPGTSRAGLQQQVLRASGVEIARWFYRYTPETMMEENADLKLR